MTSNQGPKPEASRDGVSRRNFLKTVGVAAVAVDGLLGRAIAADAPASDEVKDGPIAGETSITLTVNGKARLVTIEPRTTLLSALRDRLDPPLTGPKLVCDAGTCGACTVIVDGKTAYGCSLLAIDVAGRAITTVEGLGTPAHLSPVQAAFCEKDAMMCGFCTSGFVTSVTALLHQIPDPTAEQIREGCNGNFCRCGTYPHVFEAAKAAADAMKG